MDLSTACFEYRDVVLMLETLETHIASFETGVQF